MSRLIDSIIEKASVLGKTIVLPEGEEQRVAKAAEIITKSKIAKIILLGNEEAIKEKTGIDTNGIKVIDPKTSPKLREYANYLYELRKSKGMTEDEAYNLAQNNLYFGAIMTKIGEADGMVGGAVNSTGNVLRPGLQIIKTAKGINTVSSCFLMCFDGNSNAKSDVMVFGDCAVNPDPTAEQLADIAISSTESAIRLADIDEPKVAMLSFSTKGSAKHANVDKVVKATAIVKEKCPELAIDGELQVDAALSKSTCRLKAPGSVVGGRANVMIFPDLQSGNIGYKLVQRLAGAEAIGPICQGFAKPINDLSRGCSVEDVIAVVAITALQAQLK